MDSYAALPVWAKTLYTQAFAKARKRGIEFTLTKDAYAGIVSDRCAVTGIPFEHRRRPGRWPPYAPSLDRKDSALGYTNDNVRLVCVAVNLAMNAWGEGVLYRIAAGISATGSSANWHEHVGRLPVGVKLAYVSRRGPRYRASRTIDGKRHHLGYFKTPEAAEAAVNSALIWPKPPLEAS